MITADLLLQQGLRKFGQILADSDRGITVVQDVDGELLLAGVSSEASSWTTDPLGAFVPTHLPRMLQRDASFPAMRRIAVSKNEALFVEGGVLPTVRNALQTPLRDPLAALAVAGSNGPALYAAVKQAMSACYVAANRATYTPSEVVAQQPVYTGHKTVAVDVTKDGALGILVRAMLAKMGLVLSEDAPVVATYRHTQYAALETLEDGFNAAQYAPVGVRSPNRAYISPSHNTPCVFLSFYTYPSAFEKSVPVYFLRVPVQEHGKPVNILTEITMIPQANGTTSTTGVSNACYDSRFGAVSDIGTIKLSVGRNDNRAPLAVGNHYAFGTLGALALPSEDFTTPAASYKAGLAIRNTFLPVYRSTAFAALGVRGTVLTRDIRKVVYGDPNKPLRVELITLAQATTYATASAAWYESYLRTGFEVLNKTADAGKIAQMVAKWPIDSSLAVVRYSTPVTVSPSMIERMEVYMEYADACDKNCRKNDFYEQPYNSKLSWGDVATMLANAPAERYALYGPASTSMVTQGALGDLKPTSVLVGPSSPGNSFLEDTSPISKERALDLWVGGATTSVTWERLVAEGVILSSDVAETQAARSAALAAFAAAAVVAGDGADGSDFTVPSRSMNGFVDVVRLPAQAAYKGSIVSTVSYTKLGDSILRISDAYDSKRREIALKEWPKFVQDYETSLV